MFGCLYSVPLLFALGICFVSVVREFCCALLWVVLLCDFVVLFYFDALGGFGVYFGFGLLCGLLLVFCGLLVQSVGLLVICVWCCKIVLTILVCGF